MKLKYKTFFEFAVLFSIYDIEFKTKKYNKTFCNNPHSKTKQFLSLLLYPKEKKCKNCFHVLTILAILTSLSFIFKNAFYNPTFKFKLERNIKKEKKITSTYLLI